MWELNPAPENLMVQEDIMAHMPNTETITINGTITNRWCYDGVNNELWQKQGCPRLNKYIFTMDKIGGRQYHLPKDIIWQTRPER